MATRKYVYFAHVLRGATPEDTQANRYHAGLLVARHVNAAEVRGEPISPVAAWIHLAEHLSESEGRQLGLVIDCHLIEICQELWLIGEKGELSGGMIVEVAHAIKHGVKVVDKRGELMYLGG